MDGRHEWKHEISPGDMFALRQRLSAVAEPDPNAPEGRYVIRSLYFDTPADRALREKLDGVNRREKFRIRLYNGDSSRIYLEKKSKVNGLSFKRRESVSAREVRDILEGKTGWEPEDDRPLLKELLLKMRNQGLGPKTIVEYTREPFVYFPGNVRVTLDYGICTGLSVRDFLDEDCLTLPAGDAPAILEVKWDEFLPDVIRDAVQLRGRRSSAFSKYAQCRVYG